MKFGIDMCTHIKKGRTDQNDDILLKCESYLCLLEENYKYLDQITRSNNSLHDKVKKKSSLEYLKQVQKIYLNLKLNCGNTIKATNTWLIQ